MPAVDLAADGIDVSVRVGDPIHEAMVAKRVARYRHVLVAAPKLLRKRGTPKTPASLRTMPCGVWARDGHARPWQLGDQTVTPRALLAVNDYAQLRERALAGDLVTELPPFLARSALQTKALVSLLPEYPLPEQSVFLMFARKEHRSRLLRAFIDLGALRMEKLAVSS